MGAQLATPIGRLDQQRRVAIRQIGGAQQDYIGNCLDPPSRIAWGAVDVGDHGVAWVGRINSDGGAGDNFDVRSDCAEAPPAKRRHGLHDIKAHNFSACGQKKAAEKAHCQQAPQAGPNVLRC